jgi:hypothetical protein
VYTIDWSQRDEVVWAISAGGTEYVASASLRPSSELVSLQFDMRGNSPGGSPAHVGNWKYVVYQAGFTPAGVTRPTPRLRDENLKCIPFV